MNSQIQVTYRGEMLVLHPNCVGCGDPLPLHMQPLGWNDKCLRKGKFIVYHASLHTVVFTLSNEEGWTPAEIAELVGDTERSIRMMLNWPPSKAMYKKFKAELNRGS